VKQVYTPVMWKIKVPPRIHICLWLLANNKVLTRDNHVKRRNLDYKTCLFCKEDETVYHLFFGCCVAQLMWAHVDGITGLLAIIDFSTLGKIWVLGRKYPELNVLSSAVIWTLWKTRNNLYFQGECWAKLEVLLIRSACMVRRWTLLSKPRETVNLERWTHEMEERGTRHPRLPWRHERNSRSLGSEHEEGAYEINNVLYMLRSILPDVTDEWVCEAEAQLCELPALDSVNLNSRVASDE
jgi:hypothetical protein